MTDLRVLHSIEDIPAGEWDAVVAAHGGSVFHRHAWLSALEAGGLVRADARHVVAVDDGRVTAVAPLYRTHHCPKLEMFQRHYVDAGLPDAAMFVAHSMYAQSSEILAGDDDRRAAVLDGIEALHRAEGPELILSFPLVPGDSPLLPALAGRGHPLALLSCTNLLDVEWDTFEGYLAARSSAKRHNIQRGIQRSEQAGAVLDVRRGTGDVGLIAGLVRRTAEHHDSPQFFTEAFLAATLDRLGDSAVVFTVLGRGQPVLACLALDDGTEVAPWCIGFDYASLAEFGHYNYLYAGVIRYAIEHRRKIVNFGRSTYYIKRKYGCRQRPVYAAMAAPPALRGAVDGWLGAIDRHAAQELTAAGLPVPALQGVR
ncbi:GNAT family N-acetyltransferase [Dactylosporangium sp. NPDC050688]|uniref:GNAT family N-acetyltransferase n=1 Tax=Dactylosporangium sp. NPDC050688 TaxID=3157217 RepID=UPI00340D1E87